MSAVKTMPKRMQKAGAHLRKENGSPRSPAQGGNAHSSRRQSMLILDLQSRKKTVLRQILQTRTDLAEMDEAEMRLAAAGAGVGVADAGVKPLDLQDDEDAALRSSPTQFSPLASEAASADAEPPKPGSSAEAMYQNQRKYNRGLEQLKNSSTVQLDEIKSLKAKLQTETEKARRAQQTDSFIHMLESPMQTAIYTVQETIASLEAKEGATQEDRDVADQLGNVLQTLTAANPYLPAFDFSRPECDMTNDTQDWLVNTFHHATGRVGTKKDTTDEDIDGEGAAAGSGAAAMAGAAVAGLDIVSLGSPTFDCWAFSEDQYITGIESMFDATGVFQQYRVAKETMRNFLTSVRGGYRNNPYHNFRHAFDVTQMTYTLLTNTKLGQTLEPLETFAIMITAVCHDIDHGGKTNDFLVNTSSPLALLYNGKSVNENHHCCLTFKLFRDERNNVMSGLTGEEKRAARKKMISLFLATDMAQHFDIINKFTMRVDTNQFTGENTDDRELMLNVLLHAADLSNPTRPFETAKKWATAVSEEWFQQGDIEKRMGVPISPMCNRPKGDRDKAMAPGQIGFGDHVVAPMFVQLVKGLDEGDENGLVAGCVGRLNSNREGWVALKDAS
eukprot:SAG11_NODE_12_length_27025_cov_37.402681_30_plen_616_part_00